MSSNPSYWLQIVWASDGKPDQWLPIEGSRRTAREAAAFWIAQNGPKIDIALVLDGNVRKGSVVARHMIRDEFSTHAQPGATVWRM